MALVLAPVEEAEEFSSDVGHRLADHGDRLLRALDRVCGRVRSALRDIAMTLDYALAIIVTVGLLVYLTYALLKPEKF